MIYVITGHLGSGKTLLTVKLAQRYMQQGKRIASNLTLRPDKMVGPRDQQIIQKLPYIPQQEHLEALGMGYEGEYDEDKFGLIILDEAGSWLNSHDWKDKDRRGLFHWITHARKRGWDVALIVQDFEALDAQIRRSVTELYVKCSRLDRLKVPYIGLKLPRMHVATAYYQGPTGLKTDRWVTRGDDLFGAYDTRESIKAELLYTESGPVDMRANVSLLSAWHLTGRYMPQPVPFLERLTWLASTVLISLLLCLLSACLGRSPWQAVKPKWIELSHLKTKKKQPLRVPHTSPPSAVNRPRLVAG